MRRLILLGLLLAGCAGVSADPVKPGDLLQSGFHYFMPAPYLLIASEGATPTIVYLPDKTREFRINESPGLWGTVSMTLHFQDGWNLTDVAGSGDQKTAEMLSALASLVPSILPPAPVPMLRRPGAAPDTPLPPGLYKLQFNASGAPTGLCAVSYFTKAGPIGGECK